MAGISLADVFTSPWFGIWFFLLFASWMILSFLFRRVDAFREKPKGSAHQFVVFVPFAFLAVQGTHLWLFDARFRDDFQHDKIYGNNQDAVNFVMMMFAFQIWDFVTTLVSKELRAAQHLVHHGATSALALSGLLNGPHGFLMYYAAFFFGVSEISSLFLAGVDLFRMNKQLGSRYPKINEAMRICFALTFLLIRCIYWPVVSVDFWINALKSDAPQPLLGIWLAANICLTMLQFYWGSLIIRGIVKMAKGKQPEDDDEPQAGVQQQDAREARVTEEGVGGGNLLAQVQ
jgi:hypothetical protein